MITITATFAGTNANLEMFAFSGIKYETAKRIAKGKLVVEFVCEDATKTAALATAHDCINLNEADLWNVEMVCIG